MPFIKEHLYLFILLLTITEGPITSFVSAGLAAQWILRIDYIILLAFLWDIIWDIWLYIIWRFFYKISFLKKFHHFVTQKNILRKVFNKSPFLYFLIVKITPYLATPSLISMWLKKMSFWSFIQYSLLTPIIVKALNLTIWYLWSFTLSQLTRFLNGWKQVAIYIIGGIILFWWVKKLYYLLAQSIKDYVQNKRDKKIQTQIKI